jgi:hypothetical protein
MSTAPDQPRMVAYESAPSSNAQSHGPFHLLRDEHGITITCTYWALWGTWRNIVSALAGAGILLLIIGSCTMRSLTIRLGPRPEFDGPWVSVVGLFAIALSIFLWLTVRLAYSNRARRLTIYANRDELLIRDEHPDETQEALRWPASQIEGISVNGRSLIIRPGGERWRMLPLPGDPASVEWLASTLRSALALRRPPT